tara:strand:+ start:1043 stop:1453 length:411 start_codon:yes stop_codon:yes gene_type:complete
MIHGLLWLPLLLAFLLLTSLGWLERRRQSLFREWAKNSELSKLDGSGAARLEGGILSWSTFEAGKFKQQGYFEINNLELVELMSLASGDAPLTEESQGNCRLRLVGRGKELEVPFTDAERARNWMNQLMGKARCEI